MSRSSTVIEEYRVSLRVNMDVPNRADALIKHLSSKRGQPADRSAVLREAMMIGLASLEREQERKP